MFHRLASLLLIFAFLLLLVAGFVFALRNSTPVGVWLGIDFSPRPLSFWLLGFLLAGIVLGLLVSSGVMRALEIFRLRRKIKAQELEIAGLKQTHIATATENALISGPTTKTS